MDSNFPQTFEWLYQHSGLLTTPVLIGLVWKFRGWFGQLSASISKAISQVDTMATEHFPTMTSSLQKQDKVLYSMDKSLKTLVRNQIQFSTQPVVRKRQVATRQSASIKKKKSK